jgi:hypothetical protein
MGETMKTLVKIVAGLCFAAFLAYADTEWIQLGAFDEQVPIEVNLVESNDDHILFEVKVHGFNTEDVVEDVDETPTTFQAITAPGSVRTSEPGDPAQPQVQVIYAAPNGVDFDIDILIEDYVTLEDYYVLPAYDIGKSNGLYTYIFTINDDTGEVYDTDDFFPENKAELGENAEDQYLLDQRLVQASYIPFEFNPIDEELRVYTYSLIEIDFSGTADWNENGVGQFEDLLAGVVPNYQKESHSLQSNSASYNVFDYTDVVENEDYFDELECDYLVVAAKTFSDIIDPDSQNPTDIDKLLRWRSVDNDSPNGFDLLVAPLDEIVKWGKASESADRSDYYNYDVGIIIDNFIEEIYSSSIAPHILGGRLGYVLILGDSHSEDEVIDDDDEPESVWVFDEYYVTEDFEVPVALIDTISGAQNTFASDLPYACIDSRELYHEGWGDDEERDWFNEKDFFPDLKIGRLSVDDSLESANPPRYAEDVMNDIADKIIDFEKDTGDTASWRYRLAYYNGFKEVKNNECIEFRNAVHFSNDYFEDQQGYEWEYLEAADYWGYPEDPEQGEELEDAIETMLGGDITERLFVSHSHGEVIGIKCIDHYFDVSDVENLDIGDDTPAVFTFACYAGDFCESFFHDDGANWRNYSEVWLRDGDGGSISCYGATMPTDHDSNAGRAEWLFDTLYSDLVTELGYIWVKLNFAPDRNGSRLAYVLLGDPACNFGDRRILDDNEPNLVVTTGQYELNDRDGNYDDGDWPYLDSNAPNINVSVKVTNIGGDTAAATDATFYFYKENNLMMPFDTESDVDVESLEPGESCWITATGTYTGQIDPGDYDYDFVCKVVVDSVSGEISTSGSGHPDNTVWIPDDNIQSWSEYAYSDTFDPQPITFYDLVEGWPAAGEEGQVHSYNAAVTLADLVPEDLPFEMADEIIVLSNDGCLSVLEGDGEIMSGWPEQLDGLSKSCCPPSVGNVDGDGNLEIVAYSDNGEITAFDTNSSEVWVIELDTNFSVITPIVIADLDNDGTNEVIFGAQEEEETNSYLYAYTYENGDITEYDDWGTGPDPGREEIDDIVNEFTVVDLDTGAPLRREVIYTTTVEWQGGDYRIGCIEYNGYSRFDLDDTGSGFTTLAINLGGTGAREILYRQTDSPFDGIWALDASGDDYEDFVAETDNGTQVSTDKVFGYVGSGVNARDLITVISNDDGNIKAWDKGDYRRVEDYGEESTSSHPPLLADVDGDGGADFIGLWQDGNAYAYKYLQTPPKIDPYPFRIYGTPSSMPAVGDIDGDGDAELIFIIGHKIIAINLDGDKDDIEWGQFHHDATHDNVP